MYVPILNKKNYQISNKYLYKQKEKFSFNNKLNNCKNN